MKKILLVEDNETIIKGLAYSLEQENFEVECVRSVREAKASLQDKAIQLAILDISLPDGDGFEICEYIKSQQDIPVIFLTARDEETNVVLGLDMGADDYVTKPFRIRELISRINTVLRRYKQDPERTNLISIQNVVIDVDKAMVYQNQKEVEFTALEYRILLMLFQNANHIITREQILEKIWDIAGNFVNDNTLTVYIKRIRQKLEKDPANPKIIKTVRGIGYRVEK